MLEDDKRYIFLKEIFKEILDDLTKADSHFKIPPSRILTSRIREHPETITSSIYLFSDSEGEKICFLGRKDSVHETIILECMPQGVLKPNNSENDHYINQMARYLQNTKVPSSNDLDSQQSEKKHEMLKRKMKTRKKRVGRNHTSEKERFFTSEQDRLGILFDGTWMIFIRLQEDKITIDPPRLFSLSTFNFFMQQINSLGLKALNPRNLMVDFGNESNAAREMISICHQILQCSRNGTHPLIKEHLNDWQQAAQKIYGERVINLTSNDFQGANTNFHQLHEKTTLSEILFIIHTYLSLIAIFIGVEILVKRMEKDDPISRIRKASSEDEVIFWLNEIFSGKIFSSLGMKNPLEGNTITWISNFLQEQEACNGSKNNCNGCRKSLIRTIQEIARILSSEYEYLVLKETAQDIFKDLYHSLVPKTIRHVLGEYYTPNWLTEWIVRTTIQKWKEMHMIEENNSNRTFPIPRLLDPSCGSGTFLVFAINQVKKSWNETNKITNSKNKNILLQTILHHIMGFDINPLAVTLARINYLLSIADLLTRPTLEENPLELPVFCQDGLFFPFEMTLQDQVKEPFHGMKASSLFPSPNFNILHQQNIILGNPPWIQWEQLPTERRDLIERLWKKYHLIDKGSRTGHITKGNIDLSALFLHVVADKYLTRKNALLSFVIPRKLFQMKSAREFRRFHLPDGTPLGVFRVDDFTSFRPFEDALNLTSVIYIEIGNETNFNDIQYHHWKKNGIIKPQMSLSHVLKNQLLTKTEMKILHDEKTDPLNPWLIIEKKEEESIIQAFLALRGSSDYQAQCGVHPAGANGIFICKILRKLPSGQVEIENTPEEGRIRLKTRKTIITTKFLYPVVLGRHVKRWHVKSDRWIILPHEQMKNGTTVPLKQLQQLDRKLFNYFSNFRKFLENRPKIKKRCPTNPFYTLLDVRKNQWHPLKVVWRNMGNDIIASVIDERNWKDPFLGSSVTVIPFKTVTYIPLEGNSEQERLEAHYICAFMNSRVVREYIAARSNIGRSFGTPSILRLLRLQRFCDDNSIHLNLARLSQKAHEIAARLHSSSKKKNDIKEKMKMDLKKIEKEINENVILLLKSQ